MSGCVAGSAMGLSRDGVGSRVWLRGIGPALAGNVGTGGAFALSREGGSGCRRSNARSGPIPLPPMAMVEMKFLASGPQEFLEC